ncbi:hypothetical protein V8G54_010086 [Vigna mungo]|uniref:Pentatricopeptide repeat-containing protein n=1 Tax=Vigna mungo TaxID=3915 RepID=A0AAQ3S652_VIGMU
MHVGCLRNSIISPCYKRRDVLAFLEQMEEVGVQPDKIIPNLWGALLYACFWHRDTTIREIAPNMLFDLEPDNEHNFVLHMEIYENAGILEDMERVRMMMVDIRSDC